MAGVRCTAGGEAEGDAGVHPRLWLGAGGGEGGNRVGTQWLAPACIYTCGEKTREICQGLWQLCLPLVSSMRKAAGGLCRAAHWEPS